MIANAVNRLKEVKSFWTKASLNYNDPDEFIINVNACIQSIRNVTFNLQSNKSNIPNFAEWYSEWQECLKNDIIMKWCVNARNRIVKQSDLINHSIADLSLVKSYNDPPIFSIELDPFMPSDVIIHKFYDSLPETMKENGFIKVNRKWISEGLENVELLSGLALSRF